MSTNDLTSPRDLIHQLILIAAVRSFTDNSELYLSQFLLRKFTPTNSLCSKYLVDLVKEGLLEAHTTNTLLPLPNREGTSSIKLSIPDRSRQIYENYDGKTFRESLIRSGAMVRHIEQLIQDATISELIEYASIYATKFGFRLINICTDQPKLTLIAHECQLGQAFMLAWRTVKTLSEENPGKDVELAEFTNRAYKFFLEYRKQDTSIKSYSRPIELRISQIQIVLYKDVIQLGQNEAEISERLHRISLSEQLRFVLAQT